MNANEYNNVPFPVVKTSVGAIIEKNNQILLTRRKVAPEYGKWCIPGGHINVGETAINAIKRELQEETSLIMNHPRFFDYFDEIIPELKSHSVNLIFTGKIEGKPSTSKEVKEFKWFSPKELKNLSIAFNNRKILKKYFEKTK